jgi:hypothetical protein
MVALPTQATAPTKILPQSFATFWGQTDGRRPESSIIRADLAADDPQDLRSLRKFQMAETEGDDDFLVIGSIKANPEPFSGELDLFQKEFSDEVLVVAFDAAPAKILNLKLPLQNEVGAIRIVRVLFSFEQELVVVARNRYGYAFSVK